MLSRISVRTGKVGKGQAHTNYIFAMGAYAKKQNEVQAFGIANMPSIDAPNPQQQAKEFFRLSDKNERKNGSAYREHIVSLPREFSLEQQQKVVKNWIAKELKNLPTAWAIHHTLASDGQLQPHAHIMFSERQNDGIDRPIEQIFKRYNAKNPERGGAKKINTGLSYSERKTQLKAQRERWGEHLREHCREFGLGELIPKIDMRNHKEKQKPKPVNIPMYVLQQFDRNGYTVYEYDDDEYSDVIVTLPVVAYFNKQGMRRFAVATDDKLKDNEHEFNISFNMTKNRPVCIHKTSNKSTNQWLLKAKELIADYLVQAVNSMLSYRTANDYYTAIWRNNGRDMWADDATRNFIERLQNLSHTNKQERNNSNDFNR